jgi:O-antigen ligase
MGATAFFSVFSMVLLLLGDSFLRWYLIGILAGAFLLLAKKLDFSWTHPQIKWLKLWGAFLALLLLSFFFTHNIPLSVDSVAFYLFGFLGLVLSLSVKFHDFKEDYLAFAIVFIGVILSLLSLFFLFNHELASTLPGMNLIYATYGHNHLAAFLLLALPLGWREIFLSPGKRERMIYLIKLASVLFISFTLLISFGRTALFLGVLELSFIWFFYLRRQAKTADKPFLKLIFSAILSILMLVFLSKMYFSYRITTDQSFACPLATWTEGKLCKPFTEELRPLYFSQAIRAIKDYPVVGYGPGTFQLINKKYQQLPHASAAYTHNHFLQVGSEMGLLTAVAFILALGSLYWRAFKVAFPNFRVNKISFSLDQALFIGAFALLINAFFDFDWSYLGIFSLTLFFLGLILRSAPKEPVKDQDFSFLMKPISQIIAGGLLLLAMLYLTLEILTRTNNTKLAFAIFPFFKEHAKVFEEAITTFSADQQGKLTSIYQFYPSVRVFYEKELTESEKRVKEKLYLVRPWQHLYSQDIANYLEADNYQAADQNLTGLLKVVEKAEQQYNYNLGFTKKFALMEQRLAIADYYFVHGDPVKTAEYYLWAQSVEPWIFNYRLPPVTDQTPVADLEQFLRVVGAGEPRLWGDNQGTLISWQLRVFTDAVERTDALKAEFWFREIDRQHEHLLVPLWSASSTILESLLAQALAAKDLVAVEQQLTTWLVLWPLASQESANSNGEFERFERELQIVADTLLANENWLGAQKVHLMLAQIEGDNYWRVAQLGHFYSLLSSLAEDEQQSADWLAKASQAYETCLAAFAGEHYECRAGQESIERGEPWSARYSQVSQIIRGTARWQDF